MIPYYVVNSFTAEQFSGNPAGVCLIEGQNWPAPALMQRIAAENKLSETAFVAKREDGSYDLRFFSPGSEVGLCGHATLATTFILSQLAPQQTMFHYHTRDELVAAKKLENNRYALQFPAWQPKEVVLDETIAAALNGITPVSLCGTRDLIAVLDSEAAVQHFTPNQEAISRLPEKYLGLLITAKGSQTDFVDRSFFPKLGIPEDPVCGSAKCSLIPLWSQALHKKTFCGRQLSPRTGTVYCQMQENHVEISGSAALYLQGKINI